MDDLINRQAAIDVAIEMFNAWYGHSLLRTNEIRARYEQLPSADVQPKDEATKAFSDGFAVGYQHGYERGKEDGN